LEKRSAAKFWSRTAARHWRSTHGRPGLALQTVVTQVDKNTDGSMTCHFSIKTNQGETLTPGESQATADFATVYNFYGLVDGSVKSPPGWTFSSEQFGRTPTLNGYPMVLPVDIPREPYPLRLKKL
jgi:hypothetical protein